LLDRDAVAQLAEALPADLLAEPDPEEAHPGHRVDHVARDAIAGLDLLRSRDELLLDEGAHALLEELQLLGKGRVHQPVFARSSTSRRPTGMRAAFAVFGSRITCTVEPTAQRRPSARSNAYS